MESRREQGRKHYEKNNVVLFVIITEVHSEWSGDCHCSLYTNNPMPHAICVFRNKEAGPNIRAFHLWRQQKNAVGSVELKSENMRQANNCNSNSQ